MKSITFVRICLSISVGKGPKLREALGTNGVFGKSLSHNGSGEEVLQHKKIFNKSKSQFDVFFLIELGVDTHGLPRKVVAKRNYTILSACLSKSEGVRVKLGRGPNHTQTWRGSLRKNASKGVWRSTPWREARQAS